jgi:hypothetical protein
MAGDRWTSEVDGLSVRSWVLVGLAIAVLVLGFGAWWTYGADREGMSAGSGSEMGSGMGGMSTDPDAPRFPPVTAYHHGEEILFAHTETSDPEVAQMLVDMMDSPVPVVPGLAEVPDGALADLYVFTNGITPDDAQGPMGFQPDVFGSAPGDEDYSPLVRITMVTWRESADPRLLTSASEVREAAEAGDLALEQTDAVVNAPFLAWPDGHR